MCAINYLRVALLFSAVISSHSLAFGQSTPRDCGEPSNSSYHSAISEVRLVFFATENNRPVENLARDDFAVVDDERVIRAFRSFTRAASTRVDVIVLLDTSESALASVKQETAQIRQLISEWPEGLEDTISVLSFSGTELHPVCAGNCSGTFTAERVASLPKGGTTPLFDALDTAASLLARRTQPDVLPVIVLFSDGDDTISTTSFPRALKNAMRSEAQVYAIDIGNPAQPSNGTAILQRIAEDSGGRYFRIGGDAAGIMRAIVEDLRSARMVTYALPSCRADFHSIRILPTHNLNLQFRSRGGYYRTAGVRSEETP
jgi:VWFA-related protein